jgi:hypothetical protein
MHAHFVACLAAAGLADNLYIVRRKRAFDRLVISKRSREVATHTADEGRH